jgi:hypothetical protein
MTSKPIYRAERPSATRLTLRGENPLLEAAKGRLVRVLRVYFNFLLLNLVLLVASLPIVTVPVAFNAAMAALERWRADGEDRVVREFLAALRSRPPLRTTATVGAPLVVAAIATEEVHYFAGGGAALNWLSLGSGVAALLLALASFGYVLLFSARQPTALAPNVWSISLRLALENLLVTGPLFVVEFAAVTLLCMLDPALALIGLPLGFVLAVRWTAQLGVRRVGPRLADMTTVLTGGSS